MTLSLEDLIQHLAANNDDLNDQIFGYLCKTDLVRLQMWLNRLGRVDAFDANNKKNKGRKSALSGKVFERLVRCLLKGCSVFHCLGNVRSTTSEIDFLIQILPMARAIPFLAGSGTHLLGEAKLVSKGFKKEWVDELRGIMEIHQASRGVLFTAAPPKKLASHARNAIALHAAQGMLIVPFGRSQIKRILAGENFLRLLCEQALEAETHMTVLSI